MTAAGRKAEILAKQAELQAAHNAAKARVKAENTRENREAYIATGRELSAFICQYNPPKTWGRASRAGKRQHAEQAARTADSEYRAYWARVYREKEGR